MTICQHWLTVLAKYLRSQTTYGQTAYNTGILMNWTFLPSNFGIGGRWKKIQIVT